MGALTVEIAALFLLASAFGGSLGTGVLAIRLYVQFRERERELEKKIQFLEERYDALVDVMVRERIISASTAATVKKGTAPLTVNAGHDITVGGDFTGRDKGAE